ncbi:hypothetical protein SAMN04487764_2950 [Gillisia sp. Hel1_33_143]|uniref:hypothetical protein n=1 Tax=Gillisia sp. Hel1_33_143 TaxID=1336796 RepID=UPI00087C7DCA|nr:hypothetical protein [Gillisia sp. Hel1_33_143]SDS74488.1 hypothetical protein SAMN04487764_2950 [Gillisia sp. Hel1_33_143]
MIIMYSFCATLMMTLFSYSFSIFCEHQFKEPELLNQLIKSSKLPFKPKKKSFLGWLVHFIIGLVFAEFTILGWEYFHSISYFVYGLISGIIAGVMGIFGWYLMFKVNPQPPSIHLNKFYIQLVIAHIVFTLTTMIFINFNNFFG